MHRGHLPEEVDGHDGPRAEGEAVLEGFGIDQVMDGIAVDQDRPGAGPDDGTEGGDECVGRNQHVVAHADPRGPQYQLERVGAVGDAHALPAAGEGGEGRFEPDDLRAAGEAAAGHGGQERLHDLEGDLGVLVGQVHQWDVRCDPGIRGEQRADGERRVHGPTLGPGRESALGAC